MLLLQKQLKIDLYQLIMAIPNSVLLNSNKFVQPKFAVHRKTIAGQTVRQKLLYIGYPF